MKKIKELIDHVGKPQLSGKVGKSSSHEDQPMEHASFLQNNDVRQYLRNPQADIETIESIDSVYFETTTDVNRHELELFSESPALKDVEKRQRKLRSQLNAVSKKLSDVILENQPSYTKELKDVQELQRKLRKAFVICSNGRRFLTSVSTRSTTVSLALLNHQQKREKLQNLCEALQTIKTLQHTDVRLREMLEEEDYDGAIQVCLECLKAASTYRHYHCIKDLSSKLQDTLELIEEQIDVTLSKSCSAFDENLYTKLQLAYQMLGKTQSAVDQLLMHYTTCIHNTSFQVVLGFVELGTGNHNLLKKQYKDICENATSEIYIPCLAVLCKSLWKVMNCYHKTSKWHAEEFEKKCEVTDAELLDFVNRKLAHGRHRIWADVQSRVKTYILSTDLSSFQYDDFISILDIVKRFILIGENFCHLENNNVETIKVTDTLNEPLRKQTLSYFLTHHAVRMEELLTFLDNEAWQPCPVKSTFNVLDMQEFKFLKVSENPLYSDKIDEKNKSKNLGFKYFDPYPCNEDKHPFEDLEKRKNLLKESKTAISYDAYEPCSDDEDAELRRDYVDEKTGESPRSSSSFSFRGELFDGPIMTNTALHVLRLCGSYMKMCDVLKPISMDVVVCMSQLFDLYFYAVYQFFSTQEEFLKHESDRLNPTIHHLEETLFQSSAPETEDDFTQKFQLKGKIRKPRVSSVVNLATKENYYGITERVVATESLVFLAEQFDSLRKHIEQMIPQSKRAFLHQFYSQTVHSSSAVRWPVYFSIASHSFEFFSILDQMAVVNWDIGEIMSQHNPYVDNLLRDLGKFKVDLTDSVRLIRLPEPVVRVIWEHCILLCNQAFVEGFSNIKRCSNEGRALMQLDYQQFLMKFEKLSGLRPVPNREFVEAYIKAYYLTEADLESWVRAHTEYTPKQVTALINCSGSSHTSSATPSSNRKQRMLAILEDKLGRK